MVPRPRQLPHGTAGSSPGLRPRTTPRTLTPSPPHTWGPRCPRQALTLQRGAPGSPSVCTACRRQCRGRTGGHDGGWPQSSPQAPLPLSSGDLKLCKLPGDNAGQGRAGLVEGRVTRVHPGCTPGAPGAQPRVLVRAKQSSVPREAGCPHPSRSREPRQALLGFFFFSLFMQRWGWSPEPGQPPPEPRPAHLHCFLLGAED